MRFVIIYLALYLTITGNESVQGMKCWDCEMCIPKNILKEPWITDCGGSCVKEFNFAIKKDETIEAKSFPTMTKRYCSPDKKENICENVEWDINGHTVHRGWIKKSRQAQNLTNTQNQKL